MSEEQVDHPGHYGGDVPYEVIKVIKAWGLGFCSGNALKYLARAGKKNPVKHLEDLNKGMWYVRYQVEHDFPEPLPPFEVAPEHMYAPFKVFTAWDIPLGPLRDALWGIFLRNLDEAILGIEHELRRVQDLFDAVPSLATRLKAADTSIKDWFWYIEEDILDTDARLRFAWKRRDLLDRAGSRAPSARKAAMTVAVMDLRTFADSLGDVAMGTAHLAEVNEENRA